MGGTGAGGWGLGGVGCGSGGLGAGCGFGEGGIGGNVGCDMQLDPPPPSTTSRRPGVVDGGVTVLIVGAGLAGLAAAEALSRRRIPVTLMDARDRIGGRVWTHSDGTDAGGEFIDEGQDAIRDLVLRAGLKLVRVLQGGF